MDAVICGIDPGLGTTGYAVLRRSGENLTILDAGVCRYPADDTFADRLVALQSDIAAILDDHQPDAIGVEALYAHYKHPRTAIVMGHARGVILLEAGRRQIEVQNLPATQVKRYLTGNGRASKVQIQRAIKATLGLPAIPEPPDLADALAIALCCIGCLQRSESLEAAS